MSSRIQVIHCDIVSLKCDAIVTAANESLCGGGGVDGAVHDVAGPELVRDSMKLAPCPAGEARITDAHRLCAKFVIHAVGPIFADLETDGPILAKAYESSLILARSKELKSIAFPCISSGAFGFPAREACEIAIDVVTDWLQSNGTPTNVIFCCFESIDFANYNSRLEEIGYAV